MYSKVQISGHPLHPMLVAFPITLYLLTFVGFAVYQFSGAEIFWYKLAFFSNVGAVALALIAAIPGFIDWAIGIPDKTEAKRDGLIHMTLNLTTLALFAVNLVVIEGTWDIPRSSLTAPLILTGLGCIPLLGAGFYGWLMVSRHKVGVEMSPEQQDWQEHYEREERKRDEPTVFH